MCKQQHHNNKQSSLTVNLYNSIADCLGEIDFVVYTICQQTVQTVYKLYLAYVQAKHFKITVSPYRILYEGPVIMARSEDALKRRASKRQRTDSEQRQADRIDMRKQQEKALGTIRTNREGDRPQKRSLPPGPKGLSGGRANSGTVKTIADHERRQNRLDDRGGITSRSSDTKHRIVVDDHRRQSQPGAGNANEDEDPMKEPGAWICPSCQNTNFASRRYCNSKTCDHPRPATESPKNTKIPGDSRKRKSRSDDPRREVETRRRPSRHDETTSKKLVWAQQADRRTLSKNQELRRRFQETGAEGMDEADAERAKILVARYERKTVEKMEKNKEKKKASQFIDSPTDGDIISPHIDQDVKEQAEKKQNRTPAAESKAKRDRNNALRKVYLDSGGIGMEVDLIERAKLLIARAERKQKKKEQGEGRQTESRNMEMVSQLTS